MAYHDRQIDAKAREIAKRLAKNDRFTEDALIQVGEVLVPLWLTYLSRAEQMLSDQQVMAK